MKVVIAGASGLVGSALTPGLRRAGHDVFRLVRGRAALAPDEIAWDPGAGRIDQEGLAGAGGIINLAGENLAAGRWTAARRERILRSRVDSTKTLVTAISRLARRPAVLVSASAVGYYGGRGEAIVTEANDVGVGFLPEVCLAWETHAAGAAKQGVRTVLLRSGMILSRDGGALAKMLPLFRLGLGGRLGSGRQWMSWITMDDMVAVIEEALRDSRYAGPLNVVAPGAVRNTGFAAALGRVLRRPAVLPAPAWALRLVFGRMMANEALLASIRAEPRRLQELGFSFRHPEIEKAFAAALGK